MTRPRIAIATRELHPFSGGGIAPVTAAVAHALADVADVTIFTSAHHETEYRGIEADAPFGAGTRVVFVDVPGQHGAAGHLAWMQAWSAELFRAILAHYGGEGPDLIEFPDYLGEGFVTIQARRTGDPRLRDTRIAVRLHTTAEMAAVLNGHLDEQLETRVTHQMERYALRHADAILHPGGDVGGTYARFYGRDALAPIHHVPDVLEQTFDAAGTPAPCQTGASDRLELLFLGRLERRKGVLNLVRAVRAIPNHDVHVRFLGGDTRTAPLQGSMLELLETMTAGDPRFQFLGHVPRREVAGIVEGSDVVVVPSLWECWPNVAREAFLHNRPVLGTPVGGLREMVQDDVSGWLTASTDVEAIADTIRDLANDRERVRAVIEAGGPRAALDRLNRPALSRERYVGLATTREDAPVAPRGAAASARETVTVVIPYFHMREHVEATIASIRAQTWPHIDMILVDDGSMAPEDRDLLTFAQADDVTLVLQPNRGLGAARNLGVTCATGRFILPLDPDNELEPEFVERCLHALRARPELGFVTTWSQYMDESGTLLPLPDNGYTPLGAWSPLIDGDNVAGDGTCLLRRAVFDMGHRYDIELTSFEDWFFYRELHHAGIEGDVVPERLFRYRVRTDSMLRTVGLRNATLIHDEMRARIIEREVSWTPKNA